MATQIIWIIKEYNNNLIIWIIMTIIIVTAINQEKCSHQSTIKIFHKNKTRYDHNQNKNKIKCILNGIFDIFLKNNIIIFIIDIVKAKLKT